MTPEGKVKVKVWSWLRTNLSGLWSYSPPGGAFGRGGVPDRIGVWRGVFFAIEVKADRERSHLSDLQRVELGRISKAGGISMVLYGFEVDKLNVLKEMILERTPGWVDDANVVAS